MSAGEGQVESLSSCCVHSVYAEWKRGENTDDADYGGSRIQKATHCVTN